MAQDFYKILEVDKSATEADIKKAYRKLARKYHPDVNPNDPQAEKKFKDISEAYQTLSDPKKRQEYDMYGSGGFQGAQGFPGGGGYEYQQGGFDFGGGGGFGDIFENLFGGGRGGAASHFRRPARGEDIHLSLAISFDEAFKGVEKDISFQGFDACGACGGSGSAPGSAAGPCPACGGSGQSKIGRGMFNISQPCRACGGSGVTSGPACGACGGSGSVPAIKRMSVKIPAGVDNGSKIRIPGKGRPGAAGQPAGDLYIITQVSSHRLFERKGNNLHVEIPVTVVEAALGSLLEVPTPEGKASIKIPEGTDSGKTFRLRGKGFPSLHSKGRGDLYVKIKTATPRNLSKADKDLLRNFAESHPEDPRAALYAGL
jgi:molecular chaperone DnaJ